MSLRGEAPAGEGDTDYALPLRQVEAVLSELDIPALDPCAELARQPTEALYFKFDGHFTPSAHRAVCAAILAQLPALVSGDEHGGSASAPGALAR
jgi:hypothetical protein